MSIIYSVVAKGSIVLAEFSQSTGNFGTIAQTILEKINPSVDSKLTYVYDRYLFHYISSSGVIFLCMAEEAFGRRIPFNFLQDIKDKFETQYGKSIQNVVAYGMNEFSKTLQTQMELFSNVQDSDPMKKVQGEIQQVKDIMVQNIEKVLERGERIEILVDKTDNLNQASFAFKKKSTAIRRAMWWKNTKLMIVLIISIIAIIYFLVSLGK